jgi:ABC-2 type transport system ATP-binding protein
VAAFAGVGSQWDHLGVTGPVIEISGLRKAYGRRPALDGMDLTVRPGEIFAMLGPNGAGKTTLLEICAGICRCDAGQVRVLGADPPRGGGAWRARIGFVAEHSEDLDHLTVAEAITTIARYYPRARRPQELIDAVGLAGSRNRKCGRLSGGHRRRLDVALGIVGNPELLLLDAPTTGLDIDARREFWSLLRDINDDGTTVLLSTNYVDEAEFLADRLAVLAAGRILDVGAPSTIGGRGEAAVRVRWSGPDGQQQAQTTEPTKLINELSVRFGGEVPQLTVERPNLQDVYARMIERANLTRTENTAQLSARRVDG